MKEYEVTLTVKMLIEAETGFAAEAEAVDLLQIFPNVFSAKATKSKISKYMQEA